MQWHFLPVVANRITEIDGVGCAIMQRVLELNNQFLTALLDIRRILLRRGHHEVTHDVIELYILIEGNLNAVSVEVERTYLRVRV